MIVVKLELWPKGDPSRARDIGTAHITNTGHSGAVGDYLVKLFKAERYAGHNAGQVWRKGSVQGFPRTSRRCGPWELLARALLATLGKDRLRASGEETPWPDPVGVAELATCARDALYRLEDIGYDEEKDLAPLKRAIERVTGDIVP